jgi:hypothetical protein
MRLEPLISHTGILMTFYLSIILDLQNFFHWYISQSWKLKRPEIRIIATGPCIANQLRDVNTICRRSWYIAAHDWKIYDFKIEVVSLIINFSTELTTVVKGCQQFPLVKTKKNEGQALQIRRLIFASQIKYNQYRRI